MKCVWHYQLGNMTTTELAIEIFKQHIPGRIDKYKPLAIWSDDGRVLEIYYDNHKGEVEAFMFDLADPTAIEQLQQAIRDEMPSAM